MRAGGTPHSRLAPDWRESVGRRRAPCYIRKHTWPNQVFLLFIVGGMMLGAVSLLAPRPEASLAFIIPTGLAPTVRLALHGDEAHLAMGLLAGIFTFATLITTRRIHSTITSSLMLQFENQDLLQDLQSAKNHAEALE